MGTDGHLAADQAQPAEKVLETAVQAHLDKLEREAIHAETEAFWDVHDDLVKEYQGTTATVSLLTLNTQQNPSGGFS